MEIFSILKSRLGQKVFTFFFSHEEEEYYLRELAFLIGEDPANLSKLMKSCLVLGIFYAKSKGKEKYFRLNNKHPLYNEIKSFVAKTMGIQVRLADSLCKIKGIEKAYLFGSFARGHISSDSDLDLMIIGVIDENKLLTILNKL